MSDNPLASVYASLLAELSILLTNNFSWPSPEAGFASFVFYKAQEDGPIPRPSELTWPNDDRLIHAPSLSTLGYWLACGQGSALRVSWLEGVDRLSLRDPFPADRQSFVYRPVELLGIAAGLATCGHERHPLSAWMNSVLQRLRKDHTSDDWSTNLRIAAEHVFAPGSVSAAPSAATQSARASLPDVALRRWIERCVTGLPPSKNDDLALLRGALVEPVGRLDVAHAAVLHHSLRDAVAQAIESEVEQSWQVTRRQRDAEELVVTLCRRFHVFAQQLLVRRDRRETIRVADEYDVQHLMHALLRVHFDDVRAEEVTPSLGGKSGRMDFLLKRERIVVETKMTRKNLKQKEVGDELIVDMKRYRTHPDYRTLICFVYDPGGLCHAPTALEDDLTEVNEALRTRVIVCPKGR